MCWRYYTRMKGFSRGVMLRRREGEFDKQSTLCYPKRGYEGALRLEYVLRNARV